MVSSQSVIIFTDGKLLPVQGRLPGVSGKCFPIGPTELGRCQCDRRTSIQRSRWPPITILQSWYVKHLELRFMREILKLY